MLSIAIKKIFAMIVLATATITEGGIYVVKGKNCGGDPARDVFEVREFEEIPQLVLEQLAQDLQSRLVRAFGGDVRLRAEIKKQRIARDRLTPELSTAFSAYF